MFSLFLLFNGLSGSWDMTRYGWHIQALLSLQNNLLIRYEGLVSHLELENQQKLVLESKHCNEKWKIVI